MSDVNRTPMHNILDAQDRLSEADNLAELIRMAQLGDIATPEAKAVAHGAYLIVEALDAAKALLERAKEQISEGLKV